MRQGWAEEILAFWFGELTPEDWFTGKKETDDLIRSRFAGLHAELAAGLPAETRSDPQAALAAIIALDQFPRNLHRGTAEAFATDHLAIGLARSAVERGLDADMPPERRQFLYMPFQHSEDPADQARSVELFGALGDDEAFAYAVEHRDIIRDFGRFPHRNRVLGRENTAEEQAFLAGHKGFGQ